MATTNNPTFVVLNFGFLNSEKFIKTWTQYNAVA
jgi:hypothetical protein